MDFSRKPNSTNKWRIFFQSREGKNYVLKSIGCLQENPTFSRQPVLRKHHSRSQSHAHSLTQYKTPRKGSMLRTQELGCRSTGAPGKQWRGTGEGAHCGKLLLLLQRTWTPFSAPTSWLKPFVTPASGNLTSRGTKYIFGVHSYIQAKHSRT